jgi:glucose dehydrogenase
LPRASRACAGSSTPTTQERGAGLAALHGSGCRGSGQRNLGGYVLRDQWCAGDNLCSNSLLALDPGTGERKWHFQCTPHDVWDYDGNTQIFLVDIQLEGEPVRVVVQANRNGFCYILNRDTGAFLSANPYLEQLNGASMAAFQGADTSIPEAGNVFVFKLPKGR